MPLGVRSRQLYVWRGDDLAVNFSASCAGRSRGSCPGSYCSATPRGSLPPSSSVSPTGCSGDFRPESHCSAMPRGSLPPSSSVSPTGCSGDFRPESHCSASPRGSLSPSSSVCLRHTCERSTANCWRGNVSLPCSAARGQAEKCMSLYLAVTGFLLLSHMCAVGGQRSRPEPRVHTRGQGPRCVDVQHPR